MDGSGKTTLARQLQEIDLERTRILVRDDKPEQALDNSLLVNQRLIALRELVWDYDPKEAVWEYGTRYWLHSLASWFWLYYETVITQAGRAAPFVVTDGWAIKHWARFRMHESLAICAAADRVFRQLPWPDRTVLLPPGAVAGDRSTKQLKPSEFGAFQPGGTTKFDTYQQATWVQMRDLAEEIDDELTDVRYMPSGETPDASSFLRIVEVS
ncbi:hypothetical protein OHA40_32225 [Nocardia sp. NBC_00508]|uniref:hypothetical protein n=1 Tax=Nocardia sp. NBC_00508 TaxID=2975992 RepID=UPI002E82317D|nr:hypothetical protein [Nocardia sp. NBC_00508]WUD66173.1 hypothetical protein OHA40_32225 [Nocardia sp. NBC_00508]